MKTIDQLFSDVAAVNAELQTRVWAEPIKHTFHGDIVVAVDLDRRMMLVGETNRDGSVIHRHYRLRLVDGVWHRDGVRYGSEPHDVPEIDASCWTPDKHNYAPKSVRIHPECRAVLVSRRDLKSALERVAKLSGRSLGLDGLLTCRVHADGLTLVSHGSSRLVAELGHRGESPAVDSLGTVVVLGETLRAVVKQLAETDTVPIRVEPRSDERGLTVGDARVWAAVARPVAVPESRPASAPIDVELSAAIARALVFASTDESRPNINCVALHGCHDYTFVEATDGHRLYRERVSSTAFGSRTWTIPAPVLATLKPGKRGHYQVTPHENGVTVSSGGVTVDCPDTGHVFPPTSELLRPALSDDPKAYGWESVEWSPEIVAEVRKFFSPSVRASTSAMVWQITREPSPGAALRDLDNYAWRLVGAGVREATVGDKEDATFNTPFNIVRGVLPFYFAEALDAFDKTDTVRVLVNNDPKDAVYFMASTRTVLVMPMRL